MKLPIKKIYLEHIIVFLIAFVATSAILASISQIEFTASLWYFLLLKSLIITGFWFLLRKKHTKAGHLPLIVGVYLLVLGGGMFIGSLEYKQVNQFDEEITFDRHWEITNTEAGVFVVLLIIGIILIIIGLKIAFQNVYFWTWKAWVTIAIIVAVVGIVIYTLIPK